MKTKRIDEWVKGNGIFLDVISEPYHMTYGYPNTIDDVQGLFANVLFPPPRATSSRLFNSCIDDFYVNNGRVVHKNGDLEISDFCITSDALADINKDKIARVGNGVHLVSHWGGTNYWHWMISSLSRLFLLKDIPQDATYIVNSLDNKFVEDSLRIMGIHSKKCIEIDKIGGVYCKRLFLPSMMGDFDKDGAIFLRQKMKEKILPLKNTSNRIYISRRRNRMVENETEVMNLLGNMGFQMVKCEDLSFEEQVGTFSNADVVVSPHGAGLTNLLFARDNTKVLELRSPHYFGRCYYYLSNHLGFQYHSLYGEGRLPRTKEEVASSLFANMRINIPRLQKALDFMGVK